jgi:YbbR domain-containing protein
MKPKHLSPAQKIWQLLRSALLQNLGLKALCLASALLLVGYQRSQADEKTRTIAFSLDAQLPPTARKRELMTTLPPNLRVTLQGRTRSLEEIANSAPNLELDLRDGKTEHVRLTPELFELPPGVGIKAIDPPTLDLDWQDVVSRFVPVQSAISGLPGDGLDVGTVRVEPDVVELIGPESLIRTVQNINVAPFDVAGLGGGTYNRTLALEAPPSRMHLANRNGVVVSVEIRRRLVTTSFTRLMVEVVGHPNAVVTPSKVDVLVKGAPEVIRALAQDLVVPRVDLSGVDLTKHGSASLGVTVDLSNASAEVQPPSVKVTW